MPGQGNWTYGKKRSDAGRKGRGSSANVAKEPKDWQAILARIEAIVARAELAGDTMKDNRQVLHLPLKARNF